MANEFKAESGAYSVITDREATGDKSVTLDKDEKAVLLSKYRAESITRAGGGPADGKPDKQEFNIYDFKAKKYKKELLALKFPKAKGNELRLYFSKSTGFYPEPGDTFFIFTQQNEDLPFIGFTSNIDWSVFSDIGEKAVQYENNYLIDEDDAEYQKAVNSPKPPMKLRSTQGFQYERSPVLAVEALEAAGYTCENNPEHTTFISASTSKQYMEAHHLIPVSKTEYFESSLDVVENLVSLCPNCHRKIHFAAEVEKKEIIANLYAKREDALQKAGLIASLEEIYNLYGA
nr:HNH endonuclease [Halomonas venusta]